VDGKALELETEEAGSHAATRAAQRKPARAHGHLFVPRRWHRPKIMKWLRRTHAWFGLWGAVLGLLFGVTGILLNHRAVLKIPAAKNAETQFQVALTDPLPAEPAALGRFLQQELKLGKPPARPRVEPARAVPWGDGGIRQPERWQLNFATPHETVMVEYWVGNRYVSVRRLDPNFFAWLNRLHMGTGAGVGWILLADTLAGGLIVLALTGLLLWTRLHGPRLAALALLGGCFSLLLAFGLSGL
jgi:uncharacterized protein